MARKSSKSQPLLLGFDSLLEEVQPQQSSPPSSDGSSTVVVSSKATADTPRSADELSPFPQAGELVILVDSHSLIYQVFHALPSMTSPKGQEVGAVHGFLRDIANLLQNWKPDFFVCTFDASDRTFRNDIYDQYKAHREPMPDALRDQLPIIQDALDLLHVPKLSMVGYEADDLMATLAADASSRGAKVLLVTSDKDCRQLISDRVQMLNVRKNEIFGESELRNTWGIRPDQVVDFQSLVGDSVDNVPGVPMIGPKAAQQLLDQFDSLDEILANIDAVAGAKKQENLRLHQDKALMSRDLVRLKQDVPIELPWSKMRPEAFLPEPALQMFRDLGLRKLAEAYLSLLGDLPETEAHANQLPTENYRTILSIDDLRALIDELKSAPIVAIDTESTSTRPRDADLVGLSLSWRVGYAAYIPVQTAQIPNVLPWSTIREWLQPILNDASRSFIGQNIKYDLILLRSHGVEIANIGFDTMVADYLLDAGGRNHDLEELAKRWLGVKTIPITELIGSGRDSVSMADVPLEKIARYACEDVDIPMRLYPKMKDRLVEEHLIELMETLELPLIRVLADMEMEGIRVSPERLAELSGQFQHQTLRLFDEIMELAGQSFNPDSPKQLATILFDTLGLRVVKRTKSGPSTDAEVLEELADEHPLPAKIVEYRQFTKLKNTYVDALPRLISPRTNRVHTSFRQDIAATGRLSSIEPNLQNIPIRTAEGRSIRSAFLARETGWSLLSADYSQIELRVLAHYCGDSSLCAAFANDHDIHTMVAAEIHSVPMDQVTSEMRRRAKAVNFGIIYGQSPFGLAKSLGISRQEASAFIDAYFERYPAVRSFISDVLVRCRKNGYVETMSGRKRSLLGIRDFPNLPENKQKQLLEPERMAVNTVIQGSAADLIKKAMIELRAQRLAQPDCPWSMILQIHDELVFDCPEDSCLELSRLVRQVMENVVSLHVPLKVEIKYGPDWSSQTKTPQVGA
jgi:DNA polymerase I